MSDVLPQFFCLLYTTVPHLPPLLSDTADALSFAGINERVFSLTCKRQKKQKTNKHGLGLLSHYRRQGNRIPPVPAIRSCFLGGP
jgi:hypothetical protein